MLRMGSVTPASLGEFPPRPCNSIAREFTVYVRAAGKAAPNSADPEERVEAGDLPPEVRGGRELENQTSGGTFDEQVAAVEGGLLRRALSTAGSSQKDDASALGLTYDRFRHLLRKHGLIGG